VRKAPWLAAVALALAFGAVTLSRAPWRDSTSSGEVPPAESTSTKTAVRRFWEVYRRATDLRTAGRWAEARDAYREALALDPDHEDALYYLGNTELELGDYQGAAAAWERLVAVNPASARGHSRLGDLYACPEPGAPRDLSRAEAEYRRALELNREETGPLLHLGELALIRGDLPAASSAFAAVIASNPRSVEAHLLQGYLSWKQGRTGSALERFRHAVELAHAPPPAQPTPGEGDTKRGTAPAAAPSTICRPFAALVRALAQVDSANAPARLSPLYRQLDLRLAQLAVGARR